MSSNSEIRVIKKYPNRRLYDTAVSSYITLEDVRKLVVDNIPIQVIDARTQEDITHTTLLQIIMESEEKGPSLFTTDSLQKMIRYYSGSMQEMQKMLKTMFEQSMAFMGDTQKQGMFDPTQTQNSLQQWQKMQQQWMSTWMKQMDPSWSKPKSEDAPEDQNENENPNANTNPHHRGSPR